ncbi:galactitol-1-phosphate 5-dehydrogenase [Aggregatilinea lenta]|uniref:galactitol-1-phosphate 5-dehydrogenase n=1 Tax=Aggregatilinea lenta TaxID=913108 RepID=UPI000E5C1AFF|nr:galactitol-1-phosphate 5-dehydrogenase [Aggregatilinea lenta]
MKAAILENKGVMTYQDAPMPEPGPGHVLMQVKAASICGSDIKRFAEGHRMYPLILGHEVAGIISAVGEDVDPGLVGQHAAIIPVVPCFECEECERGYYSACHSYSFIGSRQAGGFADYVEIPARNALIVPDDLPFEKAALIEPSTVARHMLDLGNFQPGQSAVVFGAGSIGLMTVQWLRILGASLIVCTDISDANLETARKLGAHVTLNPKSVDVPGEIRKLAGDGVDAAFEASGSPQALLQTIEVVRPRGVVVLGGNQPADATFPSSFIENMMRKELSLVGCFMSYSAPFPGHEWTDTVDALRSGALDMDTMISHHFPLSDAPDVFARIASHELAHRKIILLPEEV